MDQKFSYTKLILRNDIVCYGKDHLVSYEKKHYGGQRAYKKVQYRRLSNGCHQLVFLDFGVEEVLRALRGEDDDLFKFKFSLSDVLQDQSGTLSLSSDFKEEVLYQYRVDDYYPFNNAAYKMYQHLARQVRNIDAGLHPVLMHHLQYYLSLHSMFLRQATGLYRDGERIIATIETLVNSRIKSFKKGVPSESTFSFDFYINRYLPEDFNIGNHSAYGAGRLSLLQKYPLK